jgi:hypothetical protein
MTTQETPGDSDPIPAPVAGVLNFFSETGSEGGWYSWQEDKFIHRAGEKCFYEHPCPVTDGLSPVHWSYDGLHYLKNGDRLVIYDMDGADFLRPHGEPATILWTGIVNLRRRNDVYRNRKANVFGFWVNQEPEPSMNVERLVWARWFFDGYPCEVVAS